MPSKKQQDACEKAAKASVKKKLSKKERRKQRSMTMRGKNNPRNRNTVSTHNVSSIEIPDHIDRQYENNTGYRSLGDCV